jgi:hypothetical protein
VNNLFQPAVKTQLKLRLGLVGPSGSGKTFTGLKLATLLGKTAVIDTERGSARKYADQFEFDVLELTEYHPARYIEAIRSAEANGYQSILIDSLSHAWNATGGILDIVDRVTKRSQSKNAFTEGWREATPIHNSLIDAMTGSTAHIIATMRTKTEWVMEKDERGKTAPRKVGTQPVQRDGMEYEFDIVADLDIDNTFIVSKTRCSSLAGAVISKPGEELAATLKEWLADGVVMHWALNGGGRRFQQRMAELGLKWEHVNQSLEPGKTLEKLSDTTLEDWQALARLDELAHSD